MKNHYRERSSDNNLKILCLGGLSPRRDPMTLAKAFCNISKIYTDIELHFVGSGDEQGIRSLVSKAGVKNRVFLHGVQFDVRLYLWQSDVFVSLNISDNYPSLALREAMAVGLAPIVTDVGDTRDLITNGENGLLVPPSNVKAVENALMALITDKNLRSKLSRNAKLSSQRFDASKNIARFIDIYQNALG